MKLLVSEDVSPYMCQVALEDVVASDYPVPEGDEAVFRTATTIAVATRSDWVDGDVRDLPVEVWLREDAREDLPEGEVIHIGEITLSEDVRVGNYLASDTHPVRVLPGRYGVQVIRRPPGGPAEAVAFVLTGVIAKPS